MSKINCPTIKINDDNGKNIDNTIVLPKTTIAQVSIISNPIKHNVLNVLPLDHEMFYTPNYCFPGICKKNYYNTKKPKLDLDIFSIST